jgi:hypothetical protein
VVQGALLLLYCCFTAALLLLYCCFTVGVLAGAREWAVVQGGALESN